MTRPEPRHSADFQIRIAFQDRTGITRQISGQCTDLSSFGAQVETKEPLDLRMNVMLSSKEYGRMGHASIRYCRRTGMKYVVGLQFSVQLRLAGSARGEMLKAATGQSK